MNFLSAAGSIFFPVFVMMIVFYFLMIFLNKLVNKFHKINCCRTMGPTIDENQTDIVKNSYVYFFEGNLGLTLCCFLQFHQMRINHHDMKALYFTNYSDIIQSVLAIMTALMYLVYILIQVYVLAHSSVFAVKKEKIKRLYKLFFQELRLTQGGVYCNLVKLLFNLSTVMIYICLPEHQTM